MRGQMTPNLTILSTDALSGLRSLSPNSVQTCVTSPPYWGLRDYGLDPLIWDDTVDCEHDFIDRRVYKDSPTRTGVEGVGFDNAATTKEQRWKVSGTCAICGAWRGCLGLEPTPDLYVQHLLTIFREVGRVLTETGTLWLNIGDSYASGKGSCFNPGGGDSSLEGHSKLKDARAYKLDRGNKSDLDKIGLKPKDLIGIPWRVAFALQADGWYLRSDIIWSKPNPMPESVTDRPTRSHEYLFLLTKNKKYYYDSRAIAEPSVTGDLRRPYGSKGAWALDGRPEEQKHGGELRSKRDSFKRNGSKREQVIPNQTVGTHRPDRKEGNWDTATRNRRSVWSIATTPYREAHFATFPVRLVLPCILAGSKAGDTVLDPFAGSGTVGNVAIETGRRALLIEPNAEYCEMIRRRCAQLVIPNPEAPPVL